jgi:predicted SAM-dependent methyltransferase
MTLPTRTLRRVVRAAQRALTRYRCERLPGGGRLHVGCGGTRLEGWINVDKFEGPAVDYVVDVRYGLPFRNLAFIFAEHFLEHLPYSDAVRFLRDCRNALGRDGVLRLSTPNLDWVYATQYHPGQWEGPAEAVRDCFWLNKSFRGWGHQFLYNRQTLTAVLSAAGFGRLRETKYGESTHAALNGLERHERWQDIPVDHVLIIEADGLATRPTPYLDVAASDYLNAFDAR